MVVIREKRNKQIDYFKGFAIFLVVWGHAIQYSSATVFSTNHFFQNKMFIFIYSFHMPLFIFLSGYLFRYSINRHILSKLIKKKIIQTIVPAYCWTLIAYIVFFLLNIFTGKRWGNFFDFIEIGLRNSPNNYWFLWALLFCMVVTILCNKLFKDHIVAYIIIFLLILMLGDGNNFLYYKYMLPYFVLGYFYSKLMIPIKLQKIVIGLSFFAFPLLLVFWRSSAFIYISGMSFYQHDFLTQLTIVVYRYLVGLTGIITVLFTLKVSFQFCKINLFSFLGHYSMAIYVTSFVINPYIKLFAPTYTNELIYTFVTTPLVSFCIIAACVMSVRLLSKVPILNLLLFGGKEKQSKILQSQEAPA